MADHDTSQLGTLFYTGSSRFLEANGHFVRALIAASTRCSIHASEDIVDANGMKLWARGQPIADRLLERLSNRKLRKPIELCVYAADPVATAAIAETIEHKVAASEDLREALAPELDRVLRTVGSLLPNPAELMLYSVLRHAQRDMMGHAALVACIAIAMSARADVHPDVLRTLARAALLHDVGELYLPQSLFDSPNPVGADEMRLIRAHPAIGSQVSMELAHSGATVGHLIAQSHERLDGWGYPSGLLADELSVPSQSLLFAEAMTPLIESGANGFRRAAVAARLVPGEFASDMVNWIVRHGQACPVTAQPELTADAIGLDLRHAATLLARVRELLHSAPPRETGAVHSAALRWSMAVECLMRELRMTGIEGALSCGYNVDPQDDAEMIELSVISRELLYRIRTLRLRVELSQADSPELGASTLVVELLEALRACEPLPNPSVGAGSRRSEILPWSNVYSVGIRAIDDQHRVLVRLLNRLGGLDEGAADPALAGEILSGLVDYIREHFSFEENLMREQGYAKIDAHAAAHAALALRVAAMVARHEQGPSPKLGELANFLRQWLITHILQTDREMASALQAKGVH